MTLTDKDSSAIHAGLQTGALELGPKAKRELRYSVLPNTSAEVVTAHSVEYMYEPLKTFHSIRLIRVSTGTHAAGIHCSIEEHDTESMQDAPYIALSYVWGDAVIRCPIVLDGRTLHVTSNLKEALVHLSKVLPDTLFWIDAICIDQRNPLERNHQVAQMRTIYGKAAEVIVWLGPAYRDTDRLLSLMKTHHDCRSSEYCRLTIDRELATSIQYLQQ
jgi:hypothetical protein